MTSTSNSESSNAVARRCRRVTAGLACTIVSGCLVAAPLDERQRQATFNGDASSGAAASGGADTSDTPPSTNDGGLSPESGGSGGRIGTAGTSGGGSSNAGAGGTAGAVGDPMLPLGGSGGSTNAGAGGSPSGGNSGIEVSEPTMLQTTPTGPSNENEISIAGTASNGTQVRVFDTSDCAPESLVAMGSATEFATGFSVTVPDDSETTFHATATDPASGSESPCSQASASYIEDSSGPSGGSVAIGGYEFQSSTESISASWSDFSDARGVASFLYNISETSECLSEIVAETDTTDGGLALDALALENYRSYYVCVRAVDSLGNIGELPVYESITVNAPPTELAATALSPRAVALTWSYPHQETSKHDGLAIIRRQGAGPWVVVGSVAVGVESFVDDIAVEPGTAYSYSLYAYTETLLSKSAEEAQVTTPSAGTVAPGPATDVALSPGYWSMEIEWTDGSSDEEGFIIQRSADDVEYVEVGRVPGSTPTYVDRDVRENTTYHYRVVAYNSAGESIPSATVSATTGLTTPTLISGVLGTTSTLPAGTYVVTSNASVASGVTLTLAPGVEMRFESGTSLEIRGALLAEGTLAQPIRMSSTTPDNTTPGVDGGPVETGDSWGSISVRNGTYGASAVFRHVEISWGGAISVEGGDGGPIEIYDGVIRDTESATAGYGSVDLVARRLTVLRAVGIDGVIKRRYSYSTFRDGFRGPHDGQAEFLYNVIYNNEDAGIMPGDSRVIGCFIVNNGVGIRTDFSGFDVRNNTLFGNGRSVSFANCCSSSVSGTFTGNNLLGDALDDIRHTRQGELDLSGNYWSTTDLEVIASRVYDYHDDVGLGEISFDPPSTDPIDGIPDLPDYP